MAQYSKLNMWDTPRVVCSTMSYNESNYILELFHRSTLLILKTEYYGNEGQWHGDDAPDPCVVIILYFVVRIV